MPDAGNEQPVSIPQGVFSGTLRAQKTQITIRDYASFKAVYSNFNPSSILITITTSLL